MHIHSVASFIHLNSLSFPHFSTDHSQKYAKIVAVALAIFSLLAACYFIFRCYRAKKIEPSETRFSDPENSFPQPFIPKENSPPFSPLPATKTDPTPIIEEEEPEVTEDLNALNTQEKQQVFLEIVQRHPTKASGYCALAKTLPGQGSIQLLDGTHMSKQQLLLKAIQLNPNFAAAYNILSTTLLSEGTIQLLDGTITTETQLLLKAISLDPQNSLTYLLLGLALIKRGEMSTSIQLLDGTSQTPQQLILKAIDINPKETLSYLALALTLPSEGNVQLLNGQRMSKQQLYFKVIQMSPSRYKAYTGLGETLASNFILQFKTMLQEQINE